MHTYSFGFQSRLVMHGLLLCLCASLARADAVDDYIKGELRKRHIPGLSLAIWRDGQVVKSAAYGLANIELNVAAVPQTVFQIQSITKTFTSAAILLLAEEGKLSLDDAVGKHLDGVPEAWKDITLRHLLTHTSGIKDFINEPTASLRLDVTEEDVLKATAPRPLNFAPGEKWGYSNTNYHLLAMIIRKHTGKSYGDYLKERIFRPLGMSATRVYDHSAVISGRASGYHWRGERFVNGDFVAEPILGYGGGGILSTAPDMAAWAGAFLSGKVLKQETIGQAWTPAKLKDGTSCSYGLGWGVGSADGHREIGHGGGHMTGFSSYLALYPDDKLAVVVLTNAININAGKIARYVAGLHVPALAPTPAKAIEDKEPEVTALLRDCLERAPLWKLQEEKFGAELWKVLLEQKLAVQAMTAMLGPVSAIELLARGDEGGLRTYRYRVKFTNGTYVIVLSLSRDGKIVGLNADEE